MKTTEKEKYINCKKEEVIRKLPEDLWCDWLEHASDEDKADETFMKKIVLRRGECLKFAPDPLRSDRDVILKVVKNSPSAFVYASVGLQNDRKFVKQAVNRNAEVIKYVNDGFRNDKGIALLAVRQDGGNLAFLSEAMQNDADVIEASLGGNLYNLRYAPEKVRDNKETAVRALSRHGQLLEFVTERLRADRDAVTAAVGSSWNALGFASEDLRDDRDVVLAAVRHDGYALQFASDRLKDDKEIVLTAIETYEGNVLCYASERLRDDKETVLAAVRRSEYSIGSASEQLRHDKDVIRAVLDAFPGQFENLPEDVQEDLDVILFGLESVVKHLPDPENYSFFEDSTSEYYADYDQAAEDFLDILESIPREVLREDSELNDRVCRLAVEMDNAYYEGEYPYQDVDFRIVGMVEDLYEEKDIPLRPVLKDAIDALRRKSEEKRNEKYKHLDTENRLFYQNLDLYERIVGRSVTAENGKEREREYLRPDGGFVKNCMLSFVKDLVYAQQGLYHDCALWKDDGYAVDLDKAYEEISSRLSSEIKVVRNACEYYYSENVTVDVTGDIHLILVRTVPLKIIEIWVNKHDSEHEHGKWLAPDRLGEFCDMVEHIVSVYGTYEKIAEQRAAKLREKFGL
ncbi:MAG: DUF4116 domain-containing protein [Clostridia bacterium]|nr:DUF4116 domain-containing protein [Clostridia bacterium]